MGHPDYGRPDPKSHHGPLGKVGPRGTLPALFFNEDDVEAIHGPSETFRDDASIAMTSIAEASIPKGDRKYIRKVYANHDGKNYYQIIDRSVHYGWHPELDSAAQDMKLEMAMKTFDTHPDKRPAWPAWEGDTSPTDPRATIIDTSLQGQGQRHGSTNGTSLASGVTDVSLGLRLMGSRQMLLQNRGFRSRYPNVCIALEKSILDLPNLMMDEIVVPVQETIDFDVKTEWTKAAVKKIICGRLTKALAGKLPDVGLTPKLSTKLGSYLYTKVVEGVCEAEEDRSTLGALFRKDVKNYLDVRCTCSIGHSYNCVITNVEGSMLLRRKKGLLFGAIGGDSLELTIDCVIKALFVDGKQMDEIDSDATFKAAVSGPRSTVSRALTSNARPFIASPSAVARETFEDLHPPAVVSRTSPDGISDYIPMSGAYMDPNGCPTRPTVPMPLSMSSPPATTLLSMPPQISTRQVTPGFRATNALVPGVRTLGGGLVTRQAPSGLLQMPTQMNKPTTPHYASMLSPRATTMDPPRVPVDPGMRMYSVDDHGLVLLPRF